MKRCAAIGGLAKGQVPCLLCDDALPASEHRKELA